MRKTNQTLGALGIPVVLLSLAALGSTAAPEQAAAPTPQPLNVILKAPAGQAPALVKADSDLRLDFHLSSLDDPARAPVQIVDATLERRGKDLATRLAVPAGSWLLEAEIEGFWASPRPVNGAEGSDVEIDLWPAARLSGVLRAGAEDDLPTWLTVRLAQGAGSGAAGERFDLSCPVGAEGRWTCKAPAGVFDLRLGTRRHVPRYLWAQRLEAGEDRDLGMFALEHGASLVGWVTAPSLDPERLSKVELTLAPKRVRLDSAEDFGSPRDQLRQLRGHPNGRGFFQLTGVEPGRYTLVARANGLAAAELPSLDVAPAVESSLVSPLHLQPPAEVTLYFEPPFSPQGEPWTVRLLQKGTRSPVSEGVADLGGVWSDRDLAAGHYLVAIESGEGRFHSRWHMTDLVLEPMEQSFVIELPVLPLRGSLTYDGEPVEATLWFGGVNKATSVHFETDEDGEFRGHLPRDGRWPVEVELAGSGALLALEPVEVERAPAGAPTELDLRLPASRLSGRVIDETGQPMPEADVRIIDVAGERRALEGSVDEEGEFSFLGLAPGEVQVQASAPEGESAWTPVTLVEEGESGPLELTIRRTHKVAGRVTDARGPVSGVLVRALPGGDALGTLESAITGPDGRFELEIESSTPSLDVWIMPPSHALRVLRVAVPEEGQPLELRLSPHGGQLRLSGGGRTARNLSLYRDGIRVPVGMLAKWNLALGLPTSPLDLAPLDMPRVEEGRYFLCAEPLPAESRMLISQGAAAGGCVAGDLFPGAQLELALEPPENLESPSENPS